MRFGWFQSCVPVRTRHSRLEDGGGVEGCSEIMTETIKLDDGSRETMQRDHSRNKD